MPVLSKPCASTDCTYALFSEKSYLQGVQNIFAECEIAQPIETTQLKPRQPRTAKPHLNPMININTLKPTNYGGVGLFESCMMRGAPRGLVPRLRELRCRGDFCCEGSCFLASVLGATCCVFGGCGIAGFTVSPCCFAFSWAPSWSIPCASSEVIRPASDICFSITAELFSAAAFASSKPAATCCSISASSLEICSICDSVTSGGTEGCSSCCGAAVSEGIVGIDWTAGATPAGGFRRRLIFSGRSATISEAAFVTNDDDTAFNLLDGEVADLRGLFDPVCAFTGFVDECERHFGSGGVDACTDEGELAATSTGLISRAACCSSMVGSGAGGLRKSAKACACFTRGEAWASFLVSRWDWVFVNFSTASSDFMNSSALGSERLWKMNGTARKRRPAVLRECSLYARF